MRISRGVLLCLLGLPLNLMADGSDWPLWGDLSTGPHGVGFQVIEVVDAGRSLEPYEQRPLRMLVWYPAAPRTGEPMQHGGYLDARPSETAFAAYYDHLQSMDHASLQKQFHPANEEAYRATLAHAVPSRRAAKVAAGEFPLVMHLIGRNVNQQESTVLWEYLASHGFVVVTLPQVPASLVSGSVGFTPSDIRMQQADAQLAIHAMQGLPYVDADRLAVLGHSSGGAVSMVLDGDVDAVVGLDSVVTSKDGKALLLQQMEFNPGTWDRPTLQLYGIAKGGLDLSLLSLLVASDRQVVRLGGATAPPFMTHFDFQNWPLYNAALDLADDRGERYRPTQDAARIHRAMIELVRAYLQHVVVERRPVQDFSVDLALPEDWYSSEFRRSD